MDIFKSNTTIIIISSIALLAILYILLYRKEKFDGGGRPDHQLESYSIDILNNKKNYIFNLIDKNIVPIHKTISIIDSKDTIITSINTQSPRSFRVQNSDTNKEFIFDNNNVSSSKIVYNKHEYYIHRNPDNTRVITTNNGLIIAVLNPFEISVLEEMQDDLKIMCMMVYLL